MSIIVVGVGALGSHVVQFLRNEDAPITVIDFDRVEQKNVASQFHGKTSVGKKKAEALKQLMGFLYGYRCVKAINHRLTNDNTELLTDAKLVIDCLDNGNSRRLVQNYVRAHKIPCLHGALATDGAFGRVVWDAAFVIDDETGVGEPTCEDGEFLPFIAITAAYLARAAQLFLREDRQVGFSISPVGAIAV